MFDSMESFIEFKLKQYMKKYGVIIVPVEPNDLQLEAGLEQFDVSDCPDDEVERIYKAMCKIGDTTKTREKF